MMRNRCIPFRTAVLLILVLVLAAPVVRAGDAPVGEGALFLWQARSAKATVYLLGSMHAAKGNLYPLDRAIEKAWADSPALVVEVNLDGVDMAAMQQELLSRGMYDQGKTLQDSVSEETWALLVEHLEARGLTTAGFGSMKPWFLSMVLTVTEMTRSGYQEQFGIDRHFLDLAAAAGKPVLELESGDFQMELLSGLDNEMQELFLVSTLTEMKDFPKRMDELVSAWSSGDANALERLIREGASKDKRLEAVLEKMIYERNETMAEKITGFLRDGKNCFVVVGAAHLVGQRGIVQLLAGMDSATWKVTRVPPAGRAVKEAAPAEETPTPAKIPVTTAPQQ